MSKACSNTLPALHQARGPNFWELGECKKDGKGKKSGEKEGRERWGRRKKGRGKGEEEGVGEGESV